MSTLELLNSRLFEPEAIDPETARFNRNLERLLASKPPTHSTTPQEIRKFIESGRSWMGPVKHLEGAADRVVGVGGQEVTVRVVVPEEVNGVYLHIHGGGFVLGRPVHSDPLLVETANRCRVAVVSVDYRLAPEHPYPAAADDCEAAALWLIENAESEFGSKKLVIGGESAGANLSAVTLVRMREKHGFSGFLGANLVYGCYDISMTPSQRNWGERELVISTPTIEWFNKHYVPDIEIRDDPDVSPLYADLSRMPPAFFTVGTLDPLLDDTLFMHSRWLAAGNEARLTVYPGGTHVFTLFPIRIAREANDRMFDFISKSISPERQRRL